MAFPATKPKSARNHRKEWRSSMPPPQYRIKVKDAIKAAGNGKRLADALGLTRGAVYQWVPPYRHDPYMPLAAAIKFTENQVLMDALHAIHNGG